MNIEYQKKIAALRANSASGDSSTGVLAIAGIFALVGPSTEWDLICYMQQKNVWIYSDPNPEQPANYSPGLPIEFGLFLYWIYNPPALTPSSVLAVIDEIKTDLDSTYGITGTQMTSPNYDLLGSTSSSLIYTDGSVLSTEKYASYDIEWFIAFFTLYQTFEGNNGNGIFYNGVMNFPIASPAIAPINASGATANTISIALMGDWGTGDTSSKGVMNQITALSPDYIVHLGDVYYAGTPAFGDPNYKDYEILTLNEEKNNLVDAWPSAYNGKSFTLNSNHEMYSGANGYFYDAMAVNANPPGSTSPFSAQLGYSYFALQCGDWTILGLDSAFMSSPFDAFMEGSIGGSNGLQGEWITSLNLDPAKTIVLTHHNGIAYDCSAAETLWAEIGTGSGALGGDPFAWYWGHIHNAFAYNSPVSIPASTFNTNTFARCTGHGALPYGFANGVTQTAYQANSVQPNGQLYNGFVLLTIELTNGTVSSITEGFYDQSNYDAGNPSAATNAIWTNVLYQS